VWNGYHPPQKATIDQYALGILFIPLMDLFDHRHHLPRIAAAVSHLNPYDDLRVRIGAES
jgi:hypothetical protein